MGNIDSILTKKDTEMFNGFPYHFQREIDKRYAIRTIFEAVARIHKSRAIEVPLAAPIDFFVGVAPRPISEKNSWRLFRGSLPEGPSFAIRYEGTTLVSKYVADLINKTSSSNFRFHYFQEMLRLELSNELDRKHLRSFHQAGVEFFALDEKKHLANKVEIIKLIIEFCEKLQMSSKIRISHADVIRGPLSSTRIQLPGYTKRQIIGLLEKHKTGELKDLFKILRFDEKCGKALLELSVIGITRISDAMSILKKYPEYFGKAIIDIERVVSVPTFRDIDHYCQFDAGIHRSLDFYSGLTFQGDVEGAPEFLGGGDFTGLLDGFKIDKKVFCIGMAIGVERLMNCM